MSRHPAAGRRSTPESDAGAAFTIQGIAEFLSEPGPTLGQQLAALAHWRYDPARFVLVHQHPHAYAYEVDLEQCTTSGETLDWIAQVAGKGWAEEMPACIGELVLALDLLLDLQGRLCPGGANKRINPRRVLLARHAELGMAGPA
jgi:hypothetical protein